jgi:hypothetical protein
MPSCDPSDASARAPCTYVAATGSHSGDSWTHTYVNGTDGLPTALVDNPVTARGPASTSRTARGDCSASMRRTPQPWPEQEAWRAGNPRC